MPSKRRKTAVEAGKTAELNVPKELLDQLVKGPMTQGEVDAVCRSLKKAVIERAMNAELSDHLGYEPGEAKPGEQSNQRNGASGKTVHTDEGPLRIEVPRDREGSFEPLLIGKHERRFTGFDQKIVAMYASSRMDASSQRGSGSSRVNTPPAASNGSDTSPDAAILTYERCWSWAPAACCSEPVASPIRSPVGRSPYACVVATTVPASPWPLRTRVSYGRCSINTRALDRAAFPMTTLQ